MIFKIGDKVRIKKEYPLGSTYSQFASGRGVVTDHSNLQKTERQYVRVLWTHPENIGEYDDVGNWKLELVSDD